MINTIQLKKINYMNVIFNTNEDKKVELWYSIQYF